LGFVTGEGVAVIDVTLLEMPARQDSLLGITVEKHRQAHSVLVVIPGFVRELMAEHLLRHVDDHPSDVVFTSPLGQPLRNSNFRRKIWNPAVESAGLAPGLRIHDLRHTCASLLIAQGAHPKAAQVHLGHSSISVTMDRYGHLFPSDTQALSVALDGMR
jgi:integrase